MPVLPRPRFEKIANFDAAVSVSVIMKPPKPLEILYANVT